jgi:hypothetical protein
VPVVEYIVGLVIAFELLVDDLVSVANRVVFAFQRPERRQNRIINTLIEYNLFKWVKSVKLLQVSLVLNWKLGVFSFCQVVQNLRVKANCLLYDVLRLCHVGATFEKYSETRKSIKAFRTEIAKLRPYHSSYILLNLISLPSDLSGLNLVLFS